METTEENKMSYQMAVCVKQVPDTQNLTGEVMKADGTVNRSALPAIINPEDLNALEMALHVRDRYGGAVTVLTMGPPSAAEVLRECLYRGADRVILLTDRRFAAGDTLATSYVLSCAVSKLSGLDIVFCGRQAIDGDTAQIGPQLAEKLALPQFTYAEEIIELEPGRIIVRRSLEGGYEVLAGPLPALLTVIESANEPRRPAARRLMKYKKARTPAELQAAGQGELIERYRARGLLIEQWGLEETGCEERYCGGKGSPTRVMKIDSVKLVSKERELIEPGPEGLTELVQRLAQDHIFD